MTREQIKKIVKLTEAIVNKRLTEADNKINAYYIPLRNIEDFTQILGYKQDIKRFFDDYPEAFNNLVTWAYKQPELLDKFNNNRN